MLRQIFFALALVISFFDRSHDQNATVFAGCYERVSLTSNAPETTIPLIPKQFELLGRTTRRLGRKVFPVYNVTITTDHPPYEYDWTWKPKNRTQLSIEFTNGFGGFSGTLKKSDNGELSGKLKEYCPGHCGWSMRTAYLLARPIACEPPHKQLF